MSAGRYLQVCRALLQLTAAASLAACSSSGDFGEPFALTATDAGSSQASGTAGRSSDRSDAGHDAALDDDAGSGKGSGSSVGGNSGAAGKPAAIGGSGAAGAYAGTGGAAGRSSGAGGSAGGSPAGSGGAGGQAATAVSFSDIYTGILSIGCSCHSGGAGGLDLATRSVAYTNLVNIASSSCPSEQRVVPGNANASVLYHSLAHTALGTCAVPSMPRGGGVVTQAQVDQIAAWINAGARND